MNGVLIMRYAYPCDLAPYEGEFVVTFPDFPEAITGAVSREESLFLAQDVLISALLAYIKYGWDTPSPSPIRDGQELIAVPPIVAAKLALNSAMREQGISNARLANDLGITEKSVGELVDVDCESRMTAVIDALTAVGQTGVSADRVA